MANKGKNTADGRLRIPGKTVYVLGTGFSRPLGLPVIAEFIPQGLEILKQYVAKPAAKRASDKRRKCLATMEGMEGLLDRYVRWLRLAGPKHAEPMVEDLFSAVDLLGPNGFESGNDWAKDRKTLANFIREVCRVALLNNAVARSDQTPPNPDSQHPPRIDQAHLNRKIFPLGASHLFNEQSGPEVETVCPYVAFLSQIIGASEKRKDDKWPKYLPNDKKACAIISFNYDLVIEEKMKELNWGPSPENMETHPLSRIYYGEGVVRRNNAVDVPPWVIIGKPKITDLPLIKLHGSFNWIHEKKRPDQIIKKVWVEASPKYSAGDVVWPTWVRGQFQGVFLKLLSEALEHLRLASRVVFIGYSMSSSDRHIRYLLAKAFSTSELPVVEICDYKKGNKEKAENDVLLAWQQMLGELAERIKPEVYTGGFVDHVKKWKSPGMNDHGN